MFFIPEYDPNIFILENILIYFYINMAKDQIKTDIFALFIKAPPKISLV